MKLMGKLIVNKIISKIPKLEIHYLIRQQGKQLNNNDKKLNNKT
jgi:hypothetical protein